MIRISKKSSPIPLVLSVQGAAQNLINNTNYDEGERVFLYDDKIYGAYGGVKGHLKRIQSGKCCYCEQDQSGENGAVEHFRPKDGFVTNRKEKLKKPGYYWLAYEWSNLYLICNYCNSRRHKGNLFPLEIEANRALCHHDDLKQESPLLLDPGGRKDPTIHIEFDANGLVRPRKNSIFGKKTIETCGLDREDLNSKRAELISNINARIDSILNPESTTEQIENSKEYLRCRMRREAAFSSAATSYIRSLKNITIN